ncbi:MAG: hypothetical protein ABIR70_14385 [Bryobacteraceae bacterium]
MNRSIFFTAALAATLLPAQSLSGPTPGMAFDGASRSLRAVVGSFGSAALGPVVLGGLDFASSQRTRGIACQKDQCFFVAGLGSEQVERAAIADQVDVPEGAAWSEDGQVVAIYSRSQQWIRVLPFAGEAGAQQNISSLGGQLTAVEVSPDGKKVVFAIAGDHSGVYELRDGTFVPVLAADRPVDLTYSANGQTLFVLAGSRISAIDADGIMQSWPLDAVQDGIGVQPGLDSAGRDVLYVAGRGDHALFVYDGATHALLEQISLNFAPSQIQPSGTGSYLLTSRTNEDELLWSYTVGRGAFFVPASPVENSGLPQRKVRR